MKSSWHLLSGRTVIACGVTAMLVCAGCSHHANNGDDYGVLHFAHETPGVAESGQRVFKSPEEAAAVFKDAVAAKDRRMLTLIFGMEGKDLIFSGDRVQENNDMSAMAARMAEYYKVDRTSNQSATLRIGKENWPFPIPLLKAYRGWYFDTIAGRDELLNRRIGEDELNAISVCRAYAAAQNEYEKKARTGDGVTQYAQHFMSHPGKKDGLYWEAGPGEELSPMGPLVAEAQMEGYSTTKPANGKHRPYKGYIFHILKAQGEAAPGGKMDYVVDGKMTKGFAMIASPAKYGASGIMTFLVGKDGKVFEKNLGEKTKDIVSQMTEYNPDSSWSLVKE